MGEPQALLLVYHARPQLPGRRWVDKSNDPDLRVQPMTWGICRTNVRQSTQVGAHLFFVAYRADRTDLPVAERYFLSAYFRVGERIDHHAARARFGCQVNIILDRLPPGPSLEEQVHTYLARNRTRLRWADKDRVLGELASGDEYFHAHTCDYVIDLDGRPYIHAAWDHHADWRHRLTAPYLVADGACSKSLAYPVAYTACVTECRALVPVESLRSPCVYRHPPRRLAGRALAYLLDLVEQAEPWVSSPAAADGERGDGRQPCG